MVLYFKPRNVSAGFFLLRVNDLTPAIRQMPVSINCRGFDYRSAHIRAAVTVGWRRPTPPGPTLVVA
jgi:hypothetical protein